MLRQELEARAKGSKLEAKGRSLTAKIDSAKVAPVRIYRV